MTNPTPIQQRRSDIDNAKAEAERLLAAANHETMKEQVRLAQRDLNEAEYWLLRPNIDSRPHILAIVDMSIRLAAVRLEAVEKGLQKFGPDAMLIDVG